MDVVFSFNVLEKGCANDDVQPVALKVDSQSTDSLEYQEFCK